VRKVEHDGVSCACVRVRVWVQVRVRVVGVLLVIGVVGAAVYANEGRRSGNEGRRKECDAAKSWTESYGEKEE
jgi:hypothetical protein